ncbi:hypothetical protein SAMN05444172_8994 [Burkholderia sp. GAS332]|nr:hypothetical protein SAMN05444172_8994 [Burkholderia sp. GAS332]
MNYTTVGEDIAKSAMQLHWVEPVTEKIINKAVNRATFLGRSELRARDANEV